MHEDFIEQRVRIAKRHVQIGLHRKWYTAAYQELFRSIIKILKRKLQQLTIFLIL